MISVNNNLEALKTSNALGNNYNNLAVSTQRLSTGLRINSAADDAAGLAIRELQRSDIAALRQGARNVNDAISMIQTFDGALGVIDEKLIRMKELAEQAATGTYDSTQRLMIDSEFQAMGSEIDRIANATDFNGIKLLCTKMMTWYEDEPRFIITDPGTVGNVTISTGENATPILRRLNATNYVNAANPTKTISVSLTATAGTRKTEGVLNETSSAPITGGGTRTEYTLGDTNYKIAYVDALGNADGPIFSYDQATNGSASGGWSIRDDNQTYDIFPVQDGTTQLRGMGNATPASIYFSLDDASGPVNFGNVDSKIASVEIDTGDMTWSITRNTIEINDRTADYTASYNEDTQTVTVRLARGGTATLNLATALADGDTIAFDITMEGETRMVPVEHQGVDPNQKVKIHFGSGNDSAEDYYYVKNANCTREGLGIADLDIQTQEKAQEALVEVRDAIVQKDKVRAELGALQNRFENTLTNITTQAQNLQASESRISDADIAREMMLFVRNQILSQSAVAMLAQANSMPQMVMAIVG